MPRGDGTGPTGQGPGTGRGMGRRGSKSVGRMGGNRPGTGITGNCICSSCKVVVPHKQGVPCYSVKCPNCGQAMVRD